MSQRGELIFAIVVPRRDGSTCGQGCMVLMISLVYKKRAIPIIWLTKRAKKRHLSEEMHCQLIKGLMKIVPLYCRKVLLGYGEIDGIGLQKLLNDIGWEYVLRTRKDLLAAENDDVFRLRTVGTGWQQHFFTPDLKITQQGYGPVNLLIYGMTRGTRMPYTCCEIWSLPSRSVATTKSGLPLKHCSLIGGEPSENQRLPVAQE